MPIRSKSIWLLASFYHYTPNFVQKAIQVVDNYVLDSCDSGSEQYWIGVLIMGIKLRAVSHYPILVERQCEKDMLRVAAPTYFTYILSFFFALLYGDRCEGYKMCDQLRFPIVP